MSTLKVDGIRSNSASSNAITLDGNGKCAVTGTTITADTGKFTNLPNRNLVINGAMQVAQRGTSSTTAGYATVDRFKTQRTGNDEAPTYEQADVASGTTPYSLGFRKSFKVTNGNQSAGAGANDYSLLSYVFESQDMATSGWNYTSSSSNITLSFWVKSSVAQNFYFSVFTQDGTQHQYTMETGALTADTWTKVIKTIPGNANVQFDTDTKDNSKARGFDIQWMLFRGTDTTGTRPLNAWATVDAGSRAPDMTSTWYTTDNSTFEITGVQLEVSDHATNFEHKSLHDTYNQCLRYTYVINAGNVDYVPNSYAYAYSTTLVRGVFYLPQPMRAYPSYTGNAKDINFYAQNNSAYFHFDDIIGYVGDTTNDFPDTFAFTVTTSSITSGQAGILISREADGQMIFDAEI